MAEHDEDLKQQNEAANEEAENKTQASNENEEVQSQDSEDNQNENNEEQSESNEQVDEKDQEIEQLKKEVDEKEDQFLRLRAEFENYKRRIQKENETLKKYQSQQVLTDILPTLDNLERALQIEGSDESFQSLKKGVQMVYDSLGKALEENGMEVIETTGHEFDPNVHQAVMQDDNSEYDSGIVTAELQKGYKLKERVLRAAMVKVNQ
ncbi:nucleotide exchange factor GrpE [Staphylococcus massiliensis]|uniref:Protein GrpE n=1 Tax=Staphylococcus massiliensis S46 TaxID=1229783 RepID=K9AV22_9STAP|nr:nucleotide exchange factor GrpE [Staphylococcus massiliensis]EKU49921.1 heat shock protein GrpE [Staphylococcus massiliensis S46]MCG3399025.1 nucleotide exchange factor GrpE [Staphylococcus massiliensis]PNZ98920.1 nucleotide exchange factor GrpE [Staphylococcus massiliensis CCUG 55927]